MITIFGLGVSNMEILEITAVFLVEEDLEIPNCQQRKANVLDFKNSKSFS